MQELGTNGDDGARQLLLALVARGGTADEDGDRISNGDRFSNGGAADNDAAQLSNGGLPLAIDMDTEMAEGLAPAQALPPPTLRVQQRDGEGFPGSGEYNAGGEDAGAADVQVENKPNNLRDQIFDIVRPIGWTEELPEPPGSIPGRATCVFICN